MIQSNSNLSVLDQRREFADMGYKVVGSWRQVLHWGPVVAIGATTCITLMTIRCSLIVWPPQDSAAGLLSLGSFVATVLTIMIYFFKSMFRGPGFVPFAWEPEIAEHTKSMQFCEMCQGYKVPRSHHCRKCERCVLKMEHHCPWINTCCGHFNHAYFCGFLFFSPLGCIHALCVMVPTIYKSVHYEAYLESGQTEGLVHLERPMFLLTMFSTGLAIGAFVAISALVSIQLKVLSRNETGIESWILDKARDRRKREGEEPFVYPYDLGWYRNLQQVFTWSGRPLSDGYTWELAQGSHQFALTEEQLKQKAEKKERALMYQVTQSYSGFLFPFSKGLQVALCIPCADEPRIKLQPGDLVRVTRWKKRWLYGTKMSSLQGKFRIRGWFPRVCAKELPAEDKKDT